jgi:hypothetical protein
MRRISCGKAQGPDPGLKGRCPDSTRAWGSQIASLIGDELGVGLQEIGHTRDSAQSAALA